MIRKSLFAIAATFMTVSAFSGALAVMDPIQSSHSVLVA